MNNGLGQKNGFHFLKFFKILQPALGLHKKIERKKNAGECGADKKKNEENATKGAIIKMGKGGNEEEEGKSPAPMPSTNKSKSPPSSNSSMSKK